MSNDAPTQPDLERVKAVKRAHEHELLQKPNVVGVGVGLRQVGGEMTNSIALVVMVNHKISNTLLSPDQIVPSMIEGVPVDVQEVGQFRAL